jgi:hypothetical protein
MWSLFRSFRRLFRRDGRRRPNGAAGPSVPKIMQQLEATYELELACDEVLHLMDECAEAALRGEDVAALMPLFQRHLDMCADCREEFEALLRILKAQQA